MRAKFFKVYDDGVLLASCRLAYDAARLVGSYGTTGSVKFNGRIVWREGKDGCAMDSLGGATNTMLARISLHAMERSLRLSKRGATL